MSMHPKSSVSWPKRPRPYKVPAPQSPRSAPANWDRLRIARRHDMELPHDIANGRDIDFRSVGGAFQGGADHGLLA